MQRQIRYNWQRSKDNPNMLTWFFLIINESREIARIENKIYRELEQIINERKQIKGVRIDGLKFKLISFDSPKIKIKKRKIYRSKKIYRDRDLYERQDPDGLENYIRANFS